MSWYDSNWQYRKRFVVDPANVDDTLTDFPVLINVDDVDLASAQADGDDFVVTSSDGTTQLKTELESWDETSDLTLWFKAPSLSGAAETVFYLYWANPSCASQHDPENVWDDDFKGVWHLATPNHLLDSTSNDNDLTDNDTEDIAGKIGHGRDFELGDNDDMRDTTPSNMDVATVTVEAWVKAESLAANNHIVSRMMTNTGTIVLRYDHSTGQKYMLQVVCDAGGGTTLQCHADSAATTDWTHLVGTYDGTTAKLYVDSVLQADTESYTGGIDTTNPDDFALGNKADTYAAPFDGILDEVRFSVGARSAAWISTEYNNQSDPSAFMSFDSKRIETQTPKLGLNQPVEGDTDWADEINDNWDVLDDAYTGNDDLDLGANKITTTTADGDIIIEPNGTGALRGDASGNARGDYAVDWQLAASAVTMVASGNYSVIGGGDENTASGTYATVGGGKTNSIVAGATYSTVGGGLSNAIAANRSYSTIGGGSFNEIKTAGDYSTIAGGTYNDVTASHGAIGGGKNNTVSAFYGAIGGGLLNTASGGYAAVCGGGSNTASGTYSFIGGGEFHIALGVHSTISGGYDHTVNADKAAVCGGQGNTILALATHSFIGGGNGNTINGSATYGVIGGGLNNDIAASRTYSTIGGGFGNEIKTDGSYGFIGGGGNNDVTAQGATICGGVGHVASASYSAICGGTTTTATCRPARIPTTGRRTSITTNSTARRASSIPTACRTTTRTTGTTT